MEKLKETEIYAKDMNSISPLIYKKLVEEHNEKIKNMNKQTMFPKHDRVIIRQIELEFKVGSLFLGEIDGQRETMYGRVVAVGPGKQVDSSGIIPMSTFVDDIIICNARIPLKINIKGTEYHTLRESDIILKLEDDEATEKEFVPEGKEYDIQGGKILS